MTFGEDVAAVFIGIVLADCFMATIKALLSGKGVHYP